MKKVEVEMADCVYDFLCVAAGYAEVTPGEFLLDLLSQTIQKGIEAAKGNHPKS